MIPAAQVRDAIAWVDRSGVASILEARLRRTGRGRPRQLTVRALLVGIKLAVDEAKTSCLSDVHEVLTEQIPPRLQIELGARRRVPVARPHGADRHRSAARKTAPPPTTVVSVHQIRRLFASISAKLDPSVHTAPDLADDEREHRAEALQDVLDRLLDATIPTDLTNHGAYALDGTGIWSWSRGKRRGQTSADRDARWGYKTAKRGGQEPYFGYELHALVRINSAHQDRAAVPCLAERIVVVPAAVNSVTAVLPALQQLQHNTGDKDGTGLTGSTGQIGRRRPIHEIVADRGYTYKTDWASTLTALGIDPVLDLHATQYGARGTHDGARIITGVPHCPMTPTGLDTITRPERLSDSPEVDTFVDRIARRQQWAFRRITTADSQGRERYECPARAGKVRCSLHKPSLALPLAKPTTSSPPVSDPPPCCTQRTITVPGHVDAKNRQRHYWGSRDWINAYTRRSRVEGWFGNLKSNNTESLTRGAFRVMGLAKTSLMLGIYAASTNLRLLRGWRSRQEPQDTSRELGSTKSGTRPGPRSAALRRSRRATDPPTETFP